MPWIAKDSAHARVERRDEPYLTPKLMSELVDKYLPRYEMKAGALLPALHLVQHEYGWIPHQAMVEIAKVLEMSPAQVIDTASFYEEYWLKPKGRHVVAVCRSIACEFCGQPEITDALKGHLGIDVGETTEDGEFTLIELECLGSCGTAPAMLIDETLHENVRPDQLAGLLASVKASSHHH
ncbi:MAG: NADH-quinone oxidoreductase subunit NuoE [Phycisphaerales bacterium]|nr:NADH-quinone oxidoreductase subunit NuoE [Phycisphaerales bacterium]